MADAAFRNKTKKNIKTHREGIRKALAEKLPKGEFINALGRRKTAVARVRLYPAKDQSYVINGKDIADYFPTDELQAIVRAAFVPEEVTGTYAVTVLVSGSGPHAQAEAVRLGIARALVKENEELRPTLKHLGYLKRDPRSVERKKFGLLKARKAPTWVKR
tara:strand:+ start:418 stop:900 length:483 start_codon:yes stop_codon:yes gene_type:complete